MTVQITPQTLAKTAADLGTGIVFGTKVMTMDGEMPVEYLCAGDRIITRNGCRSLLGVSVTVARDLPVVRIMQGVLGKDTPETDLLVTAAQTIMLRDWRAKAFGGSSCAMVPAHRLVDGEYIRADVLPEARLFTLHFDQDAVVYAGGLELSCPDTKVRA